MITVPKFDLEKLANDLSVINDGREMELHFIVRVKPNASMGGTPVTHASIEVATGVTTSQWIKAQTPADVIQGVKTHLQQLYFQIYTGTVKQAGKRARDRVRLAAKLLREILPDTAANPMSAFSDGDFIFCSKITRDNVKKLEETLQAKGWIRDRETWAQRPKDMKLPENQDRASFSVRLAAVASTWVVHEGEGREPFEFWFDVMNK